MGRAGVDAPGQFLQRPALAERDRSLKAYGVDGIDIAGEGLADQVTSGRHEPVPEGGLDRGCGGFVRKVRLALERDRRARHPRPRGSLEACEPVEPELAAQGGDREVPDVHRGRPDIEFPRREYEERGLERAAKPDPDVACGLASGAFQRGGVQVEGGRHRGIPQERKARDQAQGPRVDFGWTPEGQSVRVENDADQGRPGLRGGEFRPYDRSLED